MTTINPPFPANPIPYHNMKLYDMGRRTIFAMKVMATQLMPSFFKSSFKR
ncbi:hypothetical protein [Bacillus weihaiensis]|nr:hypothetical protein [Bacillus weihaiensis]